MQHPRRARGPRRLPILTLLALAALCLTAAPASASSNPFATRGMWIWMMSNSSGGKLAWIIDGAHRYGIRTLYIKSGDSANMWSQFNAPTVRALRAGGLNVCAWQFVYGTYPVAEAEVGAKAVSDGANCLVIDAEGQYGGRYAQAYTYITRLRQLIGKSFPVALAGLPYIDYQPSFPYSVFLGQYGAQYNIPQMYWRDIGASVDQVYAHTYLYNRIYLRPIYPLGQLYNSPPTGEIARFRQLLQAYGASGVSWFDWGEASLAAWRAISGGIPYLANASAVRGEASIAKGWAGDLVVWAQEHLRAAGESVAIDGGYGPLTQAAVERFQRAHGLTVDGVIGAQTWAALLRYKPAQIDWAKPAIAKSGRIAGTGMVTATDLAASDTRPGPSRGPIPAPASALLPSFGYGGGGFPGAAGGG